MRDPDVERRAGAGSEPARVSSRDPRTISSERLLAFLASRRWFGAKGREPESAQVVDAVPVGDAGWIARVDVALRDGVERYQVTLAAGDLGSETAQLREALDDEPFRRALADVIARSGTLQGGGARWTVDCTSATPYELPVPIVARGEQSNTSLIFGDRAIMKLYRRLERGEHPDAEIARFLTTRARFPYTPELLATAWFESSEDREVAAMLQRYLPASRDAWSVALERGREYFEGEPKRRIPFAAEAQTLGDVTRQMHVALASESQDPAFAPEPAAVDDVERWARAAQDEAVRALTLLDRSVASGAVDDATARKAKRVLANAAAASMLADSWLVELGDDAGARIRHHGDYHLGQVLQAADGTFMVIDFEGEPARPLAERRAKHSALRDVAGMLRSFAYAAATLADESRATLGDRNAVTRASRWERQMREAFLRGYRPEGKEPPRFVPSGRARFDVLLELFETEKMFYELTYELNNRPGWVWIPLSAVASRLREARRGS
jgi:trehalose synthase-fused probable maltokinase